MYNTGMAKKKEEVKWVQLGLRVTSEQHAEIARAVEIQNNNSGIRISQNSFCIAAAIGAARKVIKRLD
jgi:uncharacterized protein (DUF1778 family)